VTPAEYTQLKLVRRFLASRSTRLMVEFMFLTTEAGIAREKAYQTLSDRYFMHPTSVKRLVLKMEKELEG
jgi:hypothetical protein